MPMTALNTEPIQTGGVQGAPSASILTRKKKKKPESSDFRSPNGVQPDGTISKPAATAAMLAMRRKM